MRGGDGMPGMNKSSRTISLIQSSLARLETDASSGALDALGLLDEMRRLERKWREQVAAGSPRRVEADFREMGGWYRRWIIAAKAIVPRDDLPRLRAAVSEVEALVASWSKENVK
jgi:hypothetical protein